MMGKFLLNPMEKLALDTNVKESELIPLIIYD